MKSPQDVEVKQMPDLSWESAALGGVNGCAVSGDYFAASGGTAAPVTLVGGMDEVGRGALAGPVCIGVTVVSATELAAGFPPGLNDSKALTARRREALVQPIQSWVKDFAIGEATNMEIDEMGIMAAMRLAGWRALNQLDARGHLPQKLLLDGNVDYLQAEHQANLFDAQWHLMNPAQPAQPAQPAMGTTPAHNPPPAPLLKVQTLVKADQHAATVAGAAVLAKVYRDAFMSRLEDPGYGWSHNVGYGTKAHREAISRLGPSRWHRHTWKLN